jgi:hypothetical protein
MSFADNPYQTSPWGNIAARAETNERADFIKKTYLHLVGAVLAFCALEYVYLNSGIAATLAQTLLGNGRGGWLVVMVLFMGVAWLANYWAMSATSVGLQYAGLGLYVAAQSIIFAPLLFIASMPQFGGKDVLKTVRDLVGNAKRFDYKEMAAIIPRTDIPDLRPFFDTILTINGRRLREEGELLGVGRMRRRRKVCAK